MRTKVIKSYKLDVSESLGADRPGNPVHCSKILGM